MTDVALATAAGLPSLIDDEDAFRTALDARGVTAEPVVWSDETVAWGEFDAVLVRTIWDYYRCEDAFDAWLDRLDRVPTSVWNPVRTLRWNSHKFYLRDLAEQGVPTLQTAFLERGADASLDELMADRGWDEVVVKPAMSAGAFETNRVSQADVDAAQAWFDEILARRDVLVQRFADEIEAGEWSLIFFDGAYSHAVRKQPEAGEFRVQSEHGGRAAAESPRGGLIEQATDVVEAVTAELKRQVPLYARVDGIVRDGTFRLIEIELIEPRLFFRADDGAGGRLAEAFLERC
ncbi:MAG: RimK family alpha-L-glutamate ligase [Halobellus sp.]|uniref:RimK family alpha-L-glutamate ligase n=1 Tax=Halobellus sp. TaxID=1979212 RepID=UPI0035D4883B